MKKIKFPNLPVIEVLQEIKNKLASANQLILEAPPGAGKTTIVPLALLEQPLPGDQKILILEPRRLAARNAAYRMAELLGEEPGGLVGFKTRLEKKCGPRTRIEVVTEGILTRYIQKDPSLEGFGVVIFDEFHERSLNADLGLALALEAQEALREDLRIIVMSATLNSRELSKVMPRAEIVLSEGKVFPIETRYISPGDQRIETAVMGAVRKALGEGEGDILLFLPGAGEIQRVCSMLEDAFGEDSKFIIAPLYGNLTPRQQREALVPSPPGKRKIVAATAIAETSLTIEGVRIVIDSGLMRLPRFDPGSGMNRLETLRVTRDTADQRRGRAGRLGPGICFRLWSEAENLVDHRSPEILRTDLTSLALELALWGVRDPGELKFIDLPPAGVFEKCRALLTELEALQPSGEISSKGKKMAGLPVHARLAHSILDSGKTSAGFTACLLAALLGEGDFLKGKNADITLRLEILSKIQRNLGVDKRGISLALCRRILAQADRLARQSGISSRDLDVGSAGEVLALAYPDRVGMRRSPGVYQLTGGKQARFPDQDFPFEAEYLVAAYLGGSGPSTSIFLAAPYSRELLEEQFKEHLKEESSVVYDEMKKRVRASKRLFLGKLLLREYPLSSPSREKVTAALLDHVRKKGLEVLNWDKKCRSLVRRARFAAPFTASGNNWPDVSDQALLDGLEDWLAPWLTGKTLEVKLYEALKSLFSWEQQTTLNRMAPEHITVPSGSKIPVDYSDSAIPVLSVRLQEMFGQPDTPTVADAKVKVSLHLLSPANRPVQITRDLAGFWQNTYKDVKKDLMGRYPKHYWPDDPLAARGTRFTRKRMQAEDRSGR